MQMDQKQIRKTFSRVGLAVTVFYLVVVVIVTILQLTLTEVAPELLMNGWSGWLISYIPMYFISMPIMFLILKTIPNYTGGPLETKRLSIPGLLAAGAASYFLVFVINTAMLYLALFIEQLKGSAVQNGLASQAENSNPWLNFFIVGIVAPVMEEYIFRKKLFDKLIVFGGKVTICVTALAFALFHANLYQVPYAFVLGLIFGAIYYKTGKLVYSIGTHMIINMLGAASSGLILHYGSELVHTIYGIVAMVVAVIGLIVTIWWLVKKRNSIGFAPAEVPVPSKGIIFANPGMILMLVVFGAFIVINTLA